MKYEEIKKRVLQGEKITYVDWGGKKYKLNGETIKYTQISKLMNEIDVAVFFNKSAPLTGVVKLK